MEMPSPRLVKKRTFSIVIIFVFLIPSILFVVEYSQDLIAKNKAPVVRVAIAVCRPSVAELQKNFQKARGRHAWLFRGGSLSL